MFKAAPWVARQNPFECQPSAFYCSVFLYCLDAVVRACGDIPATLSYEWGQCYLIQPDEEYHDISGQFY